MLRLPMNMRCLLGRFNHFFCFLTILLGLAGCSSLPSDDGPKVKAESANADSKDPKTESKSKKKEKEYALLRVYRETTVEEGAGKVRFPRGSAEVLFADRDPVLDETFIKQARLVNTIGDEYVIAVEFNDSGKLRLQMESGLCLGKHMFIQGIWPKNRWLAAPLISRTIDSGSLIFSPDCEREEAEVIVRGLNNVAIKIGNQEKPKKSSKPTEATDVKSLTPGQTGMDAFEK